MDALPIHHFRHLKRLADLRRCDVETTIRYLVNNIDESRDNWLDDRFGKSNEERRLDLLGSPVDLVIRKIQGLPRNIRPVTDGPYLDKFSFISSEPGLIGIEAENVRIFDFEHVSQRDRDVFPLVQDLVPRMSLAQYRIYNTFNSQFLRLVRQPHLFTMPSCSAMAIDAGAYIGYKALAMSRFVDGAPVLAFELADDNFRVLNLNINQNRGCNIKAVQAALSDRRTEMSINTRNQRTMAHSLTSFEALKERNTKLIAEGGEIKTGTVTTCLLDDFWDEADVISALHISVNGHEPEVVRGGIKTCRSAEIIRISCPYVRNGRPVRELVAEVLQSHHVNVLGLSGGALVAGRQLGSYHAIPLN